MASPRTHPAWRWDLRRNCSLTPLQCLASLGALSALIGAVGLALWIAGFPVVALFAAAETAAVAAAVVRYSRHARDGETITLEDGCLEVRRLCADSVSVERFDICWLSVARPRSPDDPIVLRHHGLDIRLGTHVRPVQRRAMERTLRNALASRAGTQA